MVRVAACFFFSFLFGTTKEDKDGRWMYYYHYHHYDTVAVFFSDDETCAHRRKDERANRCPSGTKEKMMGRGGEPQKPEREGRRQTYVVTVLWRRHGGAVCCLDAWLYPVLWGRLLSIGLVFKGQPVYCRVFFFVLMIAETTQTCASPNG